MAERKKTWVPLAILGVGVVLVVLMQWAKPEVHPREAPSLAPLVRAVRAQPAPVRLVVRAQGTVRPRSETDLVPQVSGEVVWVSPALVSGGSFEAGEPLVHIDPSDSEAELESARAAVARTQSEFRRASKERDRQRQLAGQSVASQSRIDDAENAYRVANAALRAAKAQLARAERDRERTEIAAPYAGRVRDEQVDVGQFVSRGQTIGRLYAVDFAEVRLPVPDRELAFLDLSSLGNGSDGPGPAVRLSAEYAGQRHVWHGRIVRTEGEIDPKSRMVNVVARIEDPYGRSAVGDAAAAGRRPVPLTVGLFVSAEIEGLSLPAAYVLPRSALREGDQADGSAYQRVYLVGPDERLVFRDVDVLRRERERVVIRGGLQAGEQVLVSPLRAAVEGMQVRVAAEEGEGEPAAAQSPVTPPTPGPGAAS